MTMDWAPIQRAVVDGSLCELRFRDAMGEYTGSQPCFLHDDGNWYGVDTSTRIKANAVSFRPWSQQAERVRMARLATQRRFQKPPASGELRPGSLNPGKMVDEL